MASKSGRKDSEAAEDPSQLGPGLPQIRPLDLGSRVTYEKPTQGAGAADLAGLETSPELKSQDLGQIPIERAVSQLMLIIQSHFDSVPSQVLKTAVRLVVVEINDPTKSEAIKKQRIEDLTEPMSDEQYTEIVRLVSEIPLDSPFLNDTPTDMFPDSENVEDDVPDTTPNKPSPQSYIPDADDTIILESRSHPLLPKDITSSWLRQRAADASLEFKSLLDALSPELDSSECERRLKALIGVTHLDLLETLQQDRLLIYWHTKYHLADTGLEREAILSKINDAGLPPPFIGSQIKDRDAILDHPKEIDLELDLMAPRLLALEAASEAVTLPEGSERVVHGSYEEYRIPASSVASEQKPTITINSLPDWTQPTFGQTLELNAAQTIAKPLALDTDENLLVCAPTGAGKTNIALMCILRAISQHRNEKTNEVDLKSFKMIYISPLKALIQQQVRDFSERLKHLGISVEELSGDHNLNIRQINSTQLLVTTPEKWDIVSRKAGNVGFTSLVNLIILDEIHLLNDVRGPALENIVARTRCRLGFSPPCRLVALSATMSNYTDVAEFLGVGKGLLYFDASYRPIPLRQVFYGITEKNVLKQIRASNEACEAKLTEVLESGKQAIVFVNSRRDAGRFATSLGVTLHMSGTLSASICSKIENTALAEAVKCRIGFHHAGLSANDRAAVEQLFLDGEVRILVSTATLAWGVNLPAHTVIIKNTKVYSPLRGCWEEIPAQDILQMLGRAGRPGFDTSGEGVIITNHDKLGHYLSITNAKMTIESHLTNQLTNSLNAECSLGQVKCFADALSWLKSTYLYVRMSKDLDKYRVGVDYSSETRLNEHCRDLVHSALLALDRYGSIKYSYDGINNAISVSILGRVAADYYVSPESAQIYSQQLKPWVGLIDIFRIFSLSVEFKYVPVLTEEIDLLEKFANSVPIPIREKPNLNSAKVNLLLQAFISRNSLEGTTLLADMAAVSQSAGRLVRVMFEISRLNGWAALSLKLLDLSKMVSNRMWNINSPFRQFRGISQEIVRKAEASVLPFARYFDLETQKEVGRALRNEALGPEAYRYLQSFPRLDVSAEVQPLTPSLLRMTVQIQPLWNWNPRLHSNVEGFQVFIYDSNGEHILRSDYVQVHRPKGSEPVAEPITLIYPVGVLEPLAPAYIISVVNDKWLHSKSDFVCSLANLVLPEKLEPLTSYNFSDNVQLSADYILANPGPVSLRPIQSVVWSGTEGLQGSFMISAAHGAGKTTLIKLLLQKQLLDRTPCKIVYLCNDPANLAELLGKSQTVDLSVQPLSMDINKARKQLLSPGIFSSSYTHWKTVVSFGGARKLIGNLTALILEDLHDLSGRTGDTIELTIMRTRSLMNDPKTVDIIALSIPLADQRSLASWLGIQRTRCFNFGVSTRDQSSDLLVHSNDIRQPVSRLLVSAMNFVRSELLNNKRGTTYNLVVSTTEDVVALSKLILRLSPDQKELKKLLKCQIEEFKDAVFSDSLSGFLQSIGFLVLSEMLTESEQQNLRDRRPELLFVTREAASIAPVADVTYILDTQSLDLSSGSWLDLTATEMLSLTRLGDSKLVINTTSVWRDYYVKFLSEPIPLESALNWSLEEGFRIFIASGVVNSYESALEWISTSYFYRRLLKNPNFYGLKNAHNPDQLNEYLSDLVEEIIEGLLDRHVIEMTGDDEFLAKPDLMLTTSYGIALETLEQIRGLGPSPRIQDLLVSISSSSEMAVLQLRPGDMSILRGLKTKIQWVDETVERLKPQHQKCVFLLLAHLSRLTLPIALQRDLQECVQLALNILRTIISWQISNGYLGVLLTLDTMQMLVQALWDSESNLLQIPHVDGEAVTRAKVAGVISVSDFISIEDDELRCNILGFDDSDHRMLEVASFVNEFPNIDLKLETLPGSVPKAGVPFRILVEVNRDLDEDSDLQVRTVSTFLDKEEQWYLVAGDTTNRNLLGFKPIQIAKESQNFDLELTIPKAGCYNVTVWCICDSYIDADRQVELSIDVS